MKGLILSGGKERACPITCSAPSSWCRYNKPVLSASSSPSAMRDRRYRHRRGRYRPGDRATPWATALGRQHHLHPQEQPWPGPRRQDQQGFSGQRPICHSADNVIEGGISGLIGELENKTANCQIVLTAVENPSHYGVAELDLRRRGSWKAPPAAQQPGPGGYLHV